MVLRNELSQMEAIALPTTQFKTIVHHFLHGALHGHWSVYTNSTLHSHWTCTMGKAHNIQLSVHQSHLILFDLTGCVQHYHYYI